MAMQRARRLASIAVVAALAVAGLSACRSAGVAAYRRQRPAITVDGCRGLRTTRPDQADRRRRRGQQARPCRPAADIDSAPDVVERWRALRRGTARASGCRPRRRPGAGRLWPSRAAACRPTRSCSSTPSSGRLSDSAAAARRTARTSARPTPTCARSTTGLEAERQRTRRPTFEAFSAAGVTPQASSLAGDRAAQRRAGRRDEPRHQGQPALRRPRDLSSYHPPGPDGRARSSVVVAVRRAGARWPVTDAADGR